MRFAHLADIHLGFQKYEALQKVEQEVFERAGTVQALNLAIEKLPPKYRMVLNLRYNDYFNFRQIAESLGESLNTVKSRHRRALAKLKELLGGQ